MATIMITREIDRILKQDAAKLRTYRAKRTRKAIDEKRKRTTGQLFVTLV